MHKVRKDREWKKRRVQRPHCGGMDARVRDLVSEQEITQEQQFKQIKQRMAGEILFPEQTIIR